jgi:hypothetical protein
MNLAFYDVKNINKAAVDKIKRYVFITIKASELAAVNHQNHQSKYLKKRHFYT